MQPSCRYLCLPATAGAALATVVSRLGPEKAPSPDVLATIENDDSGMKTLAAILVRALLTIFGAALADQLLPGDQQTAQGVG
jgi:hypothetical protein